MQRLAGDLYLFQHTSFLWVDYCFDVTFSFEFSQRGFTTLWFTRCPFCVLSTKKQTFLMGGEFQRMVHTSHLQAPWRHVRVHRKKRNSDTEMDDQWRNILWGLGTLWETDHGCIPKAISEVSKVPMSTPLSDTSYLPGVLCSLARGRATNLPPSPLMTTNHSCRYLSTNDCMRDNIFRQLCRGIG